MNELEHAIAATLRADAQEAAMTTDTARESQKLQDWLDGAERRKRRNLWFGVIGAAAAAVVVLGAVGLLRPSTEPPAPVTSSSTFDFTSTEFGLPFSADLPEWVTSYRASPNSEKPEWVTWNRCPSGDQECIGLSYNRTMAVPSVAGNERVTYASYLAYLDGLANAGAITISARSTTTVGGRQATVMSILPVRTVPGGAGCHADASCEDLLADVPGRYAVVDTASMDPDGEFLIVWTRAGALDAAEVGWLSEFDAMLATLRFDGPAPSAS
jgi:hypothetical protein